MTKRLLCAVALTGCFIPVQAWACISEKLQRVCGVECAVEITYQGDNVSADEDEYIAYSSNEERRCGTRQMKKVALKRAREAACDKLCQDGTMARENARTESAYMDDTHRACIEGCKARATAVNKCTEYQAIAALSCGAEPKPPSPKSPPVSLDTVKNQR